MFAEELPIPWALEGCSERVCVCVCVLGPVLRVCGWSQERRPPLGVILGVDASTVHTAYRMRGIGLFFRPRRLYMTSNVNSE